ncbi:tape measure protein [Ligilactobacillus sp. LYQ135]
MPGSKKVSAQMSTSVALDTLKAAESLKSLQTAITGTTNAWKAQAAALKSSGDSQGALKTKIDGLKDTQEAELQKIQALINKQKDLDVTTQKGAQQYTKYQGQIDKLVAAYEKQNVQIDKAKQSLSYYESGLAKLQNEYNKNSQLSASYVNRLKAEGNENQAIAAQIKNLKSSYSNLAQQYKIQETELNDIADKSGKASSAYKTQATRLNETATAMAKTKSQLKEMNTSFAKSNDTIAKAKDKLGLFNKSTEDGTTKTGKFTTSIKNTALGVGIANTAMAAMNLVTNQIGDAVSRVDTLNNSKRVFQNMGYNAKDTNAAMDGLNKSIKGLPTGLDEAVQGVQMVASTTNDLKKAQKVWSALNDGIIGFGGSTENVQNAVLQLSQAFSNGKIDAETWNSMMDSQLGPTLNAIAKDMGMTTAQLKSGLSDGAISVQKFQDELIKLDTKGGGGLKSLSKIAHDSTDGISTSIKNATTSITRGLGDMIVKFSDALKKVTGSNLSQWITKFGDTAEKVLGKVGDSMGQIPKVLNKMKPAFDLFKRGFDVTFAGIKPIIDAIKDSFSKLSKNSGELGKTFKTLAPIIRAVQDVAKVLATVLGKTLGAAIRLVTDLIIGLVKSFNNVSGWIGKLHKGFDDFAKNAAKTFVNGWKDMKSNMSKAVDAMNDKNSKLHDEMISKISDATGVSKDTLNNAYNTMGDLTQTWKDLMSGKWDKLGGDLKNISSDLSKTAKSTFQDMYDTLNEKTGGGLDKIKQGWDNLWKNIINGIKSAISNVKTEASNLVNGVIKPINSMLDGVKNGVNWVLDKFGADKWKGYKIPEVKFATGGTVGKGGTMAVVNDAPGANYREMFATPDGKFGMFPKERNFRTFLPEGTQVLDGENSKALAEMMDIPHFKDGTKDKNLFEKIFDKGKDILDSIGDIIAHPIKFLEKVISDKLKVNTKVKFASDLISKAPSFFAKMGKDWIKKLAEDFKKKKEESIGGFGSIKDMKNSDDLKKLVKAALEANGLSTSQDMIDKVMRQIATESGGNAHAVQPGADPDGDGSGPAMGLMQTKRSTFNAYKAPGHDDIFNAYDNLLAALNYAKHRYGPSLSFLGQGHGYANGGFINSEQLAMIGEGNKPEVVIPLSSEKQGRALSLLTQTVNKLNRNAGNNTQITNNKSQSNVEAKLDTMIGLLANILGVNQEQLNKASNNGNLNAFYQQMQRDQSINNYQAF